MLTVSAPGVLTNDTGQNLTAVQDSDPANGTLATGLAADGSFMYSVDAGFHGIDTFTYHVSDTADESNTATVTIYVNEAPRASDNFFGVDEDVILMSDSSSSVLANDTDPDGDPLTALLVSGTTHGNLNLNADGTFMYAPDPDYYGEDSFTYQASDPYQGFDTATVTLTIAPVNDAPVAYDDSAAATMHAQIVIDLIGDDTDVDGDTLSVVAIDNSATQGTVLDNGDGSVTYLAPGVVGADTFSYTVSDGNGATHTATVTVNVFDPVTEDSVLEETRGSHGRVAVVRTAV
jgi:VCBS repeat-containing protein